MLAVVTVGFGFVGGGKPSTSGWITALDMCGVELLSDADMTVTMHRLCPGT